MLKDNLSTCIDKIQDACRHIGDHAQSMELGMQPNHAKTIDHWNNRLQYASGQRAMLKVAIDLAETCSDPMEILRRLFDALHSRTQSCIHGEQCRGLQDTVREITSAISSVTASTSIN